ncbi:XPG I-region [Phytophthora infestans]|uniref:XPG I-region n=1 Tax=Phytophthora infestans TaxID=4787 RepID=A0A833SSU5_PHYIN|nr:XPG I-region [Phytophthora infestans]KAF4149757.1 XPG I-region [Phytophthora infestans]
MGISGLLPVLKSITETKNIEAYRGQTLAIDGYCWLHRAIYSCSQEICLGQATDKYVTYFMDRITALLHNGVTPYVVFDGGPLPMKKGTEEERRKSRQKNRELGVQHYNNKRFGEARKCFVRAADVSPYMAHRVIQHLKAQNVAYVVAPYEADAQLAYLVKNGLADGVITEDSDCLPFGCQTVLFKMDRDNIAQEIQTANLKKNKGMSFHMFTEQMFLEMCIFSGCDYLPSIPGFGLKKAYTAMKQHGSFAKIVRALRLEGKVRIPATYEEDFRKAVLTFRHQRVYCPTKKELVPLTPVPANLLKTDPAMDFVGPMLSSDVAKAIAEGDMDPITMTPFPVKAPVSRSIQPSVVISMHPTRQLTATRKTKKEVTSFFHASESAAAAVFNAPRTKPTSSKRKLPASFMDKWASNAASPEERSKQSTASDSSAKPATESPLVRSRFFGLKPKEMSPPDENVKKSAPRTLDSSSTFQSQEPRGVDVVRNISFDPLKDKVRVLPTTRDIGVSKENQAPNSQEATPSLSVPTKETAFSRMMRAGSMLQQHRLKKQRSVGPVYRSGKPRVPLSSRIGHLAFTGTRRADKATKIPSTSLDSKREQLTDEAESISDPEDPPASSKTEDDADTKELLETLDVGLDTTIVHASNEATVPAPIASFDRFRFQH